MEPMKVGVVGCGNISGIYFTNLQRLPGVTLVACSDLIPERAQAKAAEFGIKACSVEELLADPQVDIVLNLTIPKAHAEVNLAALEAGKHVYVEKPLAISLEDGRKTLELAAQKGLRVGSAPDTFLGGGLQTCRKLIDDGAIGTPVAATAFMTCPGHEGWHPDPEFYYKPGGGPMFDMGPYYLTALVSLVGPIREVTGMTRITFPERTITSAPKYGQKIKVEVPTHVTGLMQFANGAIGTIITSFDVWGAHLPWIEIYGSEGSLAVPDPNNFGGRVLLKRQGDSEWKEVPLTHGYAENYRGLGVADLAHGIKNNRPHRASGELANHVLEVMHGFHIASDQRGFYRVESTCQRPAALPVDGSLD